MKPLQRLRSVTPPATLRSPLFTCPAASRLALGRAWRETDEENTYRSAIIRDLLEGQYSRPVRVISFNTAEGWSRDVSEEIAVVLVEAYARDDRDIPSALEDFIDQNRMPWPEQLPLPLRRTS